VKDYGRMFVQAVEPFEFEEKDDGGKPTGRTVKGRSVQLFVPREMGSYRFSIPEGMADPEEMKPYDVEFDFVKFGDGRDATARLRVLAMRPAPDGVPGAKGAATVGATP